MTGAKCANNVKAYSTVTMGLRVNPSDLYIILLLRPIITILQAWGWVCSCLPLLYGDKHLHFIGHFPHDLG